MPRYRQLYSLDLYELPGQLGIPSCSRLCSRPVRALQPHIDNRLRLHIREIKAADQMILGVGTGGGGTDDGDDFIDIIECLQQALQNVGPRLRLLQIVLGAAR